MENIMRSKISLAVISFILAMPAAVADTISDALQQQQTLSQAAINAEKARMDSMSLAISRGEHHDDGVPILFSVMSMGNQYVLKFITSDGNRYLVTEAKPEIGSKWKLIKMDGLSAVIQKGKEKPVSVFLSVPDDVEQGSMAIGSLPVNTAVPPMPTSPR
jgi:hypothetical protein